MKLDHERQMSRFTFSEKAYFQRFPSCTLAVKAYELLTDLTGLEQEYETFAPFPLGKGVEITFVRPEASPTSRIRAGAPDSGCSCVLPDCGKFGSCCGQECPRSGT